MNSADDLSSQQKKNNPFKKSCVDEKMLNLINSSFCNIEMTLYYLSHSKDPEILEVLGKKLLIFHTADVSNYLLQLMELYIKTDIASAVIYRYISEITKSDMGFSVLCSWMLDALIKDNVITDSAILERIKALNYEITINNVDLKLEDRSDFHSNEDSSNKAESVKKSNVFVDMKVFYNKLVKIGTFLKNTTSDNKSAVLQMCIFKMNSIITQGLFIPWYTYPNHVIVQISPYHATTLNSKDKVPFIIYVEVIELSKGENLGLDMLFSLRSDNDSLIENNSSSSDTLKMRKVILENCYNITMNSKKRPNESNQKEDDINIFQYQKFVSAQSIRDQLANVKIENSFKNTAIEDDNSIGSVDSHNTPVSQIFNVKPCDTWSNKVAYIRKMSPFSHLKGWNVFPVIVKCGDDLRQDLLAYQLLKKCQDVWRKENLGVWIKPYEVTIISNDCGLIEAITDCISLHQLRKATGKTLLEYFEFAYGPKHGETFVKAQKNFVKSLAAYSIFQYLFRVKDRHNSNILLDSEGHIIHIDFGFMIALSPKNLSFETSPFKLTKEYIELMNGINSDLFVYFKSCMLHGLYALQKHMDEFVHIIEIMSNSKIPCIGNKKYAVESLKARFHSSLPDECFAQTIDSLIIKSLKSYTTLLYDYFQYYMNGIQ